MRRTAPRYLIALITLALLVTAVFPAFSAMIPFSADLVQIDKKNKETVGKIFVKQDKIRQEIADEKGQVLTTIIRLDKSAIWTLLPEQKMYMEITFDKAKAQQYAAEKSADLIDQTIDMGKETVNGYVCTKTKYVYKDKRIGIMIQWMSDRLQFGIKTEMQNNSGVMQSINEYRNIKEGPQADSLFELPQGYTKFSLGGLFGGK